MTDAPDGHASAAAKRADAVGDVERNTKSQTTAASYTTTDHDVIRAWAEARGGRPSSVEQTSSDDAGILRIEFPDAPDGGSADLETVDWEPFFDKFEESELAFVYQEKTSDGSESRFSRLVRRD
jgi:ABC-type nitrate/sulfonate/bicarbonate transport system substrate-binding protein